MEIKIKIDQRAVNNMVKGIRQTPETLREAAYETNKHWSKHLKHKLADSFVDFIKKGRGSTEVEIAYHNYKDSQGAMNEQLVGDLSGPHGIMFSRLAPDDLQEYTRYYFWTQRSKKQLENTGERFTKSTTPLTRIKLEVPLSMLPDAVIRGMLPKRQDIFKLENHHTGLKTYIKFTPKHSNRGYAGMMVGDWLNPATWQPTNGQNDASAWMAYYDYNRRYAGEETTGKYNTSAQFEIKIRPSDPIFTNMALLEVGNETVPKHMSELRRRHRSETLSKLKQMLKRFGAH